MKIICKVTQVQESSWHDYLIVTTEGLCSTENPDHRPDHRQTFSVPNTGKAQRAYYVGRKLELDINPK